jgi:hypothetical protein
MEESPQMVSLEEARVQVKVVARRLALMHLAYARTLVDELGEAAAKDIVVKAMMEYGRLVGERTKSGGQDLPYYGLHESYRYGDQAYLDTRELALAEGEVFDWSRFKVKGCVLAQVFQEMGETELGRLYCYVDAAKSMAVDPSQKLVHTACEPCGDDHCAFQKRPTSETEKQDFVDKNLRWKAVDPILADTEEDG